MWWAVAWTKSRKSYFTTPGVGVSGGGVSKKFKVFYVMGKALSGELSCPCDRSCLYFTSFDSQAYSFIFNTRPHHTNTLAPNPAPPPPKKKKKKKKNMPPTELQVA